MKAFFCLTGSAAMLFPGWTRIINQYSVKKLTGVNTKSLVILLLCLPLLWSRGFAQTRPDPEKIATYVRSHSEDDLRKLFDANGFKVAGCIKGYPECFDGYDVFVNSTTVGGNTETHPPHTKALHFEKGKIVSSSASLNTEIAFTLTAKNYLSDDCVVFVGTNSYTYVLDFFRFRTPMLISVTIGGVTFTDTKYKGLFLLSTTGNEEEGNNKDYDFSSLANGITCKVSKKAATPVYEDIGGYFSGGMLGVKYNGKWAVIDKTGQNVIPFLYDTPPFYREGLAAVSVNKKFGFIDKTGKEVVPLKYEDANSFHEGLASVKINGKYGFIDKTGKPVIGFKYDDAGDFHEGFAAVGQGDRYAFIDKKGREITPFKYNSRYAHFSEGLASVGADGKYGFVDTTGKEVIPLIYAMTSHFYEGLASAMVGYRTGFIDKSGKEVIPCQYEYMSINFSEGLAKVRLNNRISFIDRTGKQIIPISYFDAADFHEGLSAVVNANKYGFIDKTGKEIIPLQYDFAFDFSEGLAIVKLNGKYMVIDKTGKRIIQ